MSRMTVAKWQRRYLDIAKNVASWSKDPGTQVGAIAVGKKGQILSQGYNGFPRGVRDTPERLNDREQKLKFTIHAELNLVFNASFSGISLEDSTVYVYGLPTCSECAKAMIQAGVKNLVIPASLIDKKPEWKDSWELSKVMFQEAGLNITEVEDYE